MRPACSRSFCAPRVRTARIRVLRCSPPHETHGFRGDPESAARAHPDHLAARSLGAIPQQPPRRDVGLMLSAIAAFGRFWYRFIVGDDWSIALAVLVGLALTYALRRRASTAWWLMPAVVVVVLGVSLYRARLSKGGSSRQ